MKRFLKPKNRRGFVLAELLIVVAIIAVLLSLAFVGIIRYQRSLEQLEMDGMAKEIFVAAQNHLTLAESQGLVSGLVKPGDNEATVKGKWGTLVDSANGYYMVKSSDDPWPEAMKLMLPFGSVDETVRLGGDYVIIYQPNNGRVIDVFYSEDSSKKFGYSYKDTGYNILSGLRDDKTTGKSKKMERRDYGDSRSVIGWYGGEGLTSGPRLNPPRITVQNNERLTVTFTDSNPTVDDVIYQILVTGVNSGAQQLLEFKKNDALLPRFVEKKDSTYVIVLDDVTQADLRFDQNGWDPDTKKPGPTGQLLSPGENITIKVKAMTDSTSSVTRAPALSNEAKTNSLFGDDTASGTAEIKTIRHLENLSTAVSGVNKVGAATTIHNAVQTNDLDWIAFTNRIKEVSPNYNDAKNVCIYSGSSLSSLHSADGTYLPVELTSDSTYININYRGVEKTKKDDGTVEYTDKSDRKISNVVINPSGDAGIFGTIKGNVSNLMLENITCKIDGSTTAANAGALAGRLDGGTVSRVLAYNKPASGSDDSGYLIKGTSAAGGLVGTMSGGSIDQCAAAVYVEATDGDAGGLVGKVTGTATVENSYAGGHTNTGKYSNKDSAGIEITGARFEQNVTASGNAGGLIGSNDGGTVKNCYATTSVYGSDSGAVCGGLIGDNSGSVSDCYATGLVSRDGTARKEMGTFFGKTSGTLSGNTYLSIINDGMASVGPSAEPGDNYTPEKTDNISAFDENVQTYNLIARNAGTSQPYDKEYLKNNYAGKYAFSTINDLTNPADTTGLPIWLDRHYGDWPSPETLVVNTPG